MPNNRNYFTRYGFTLIELLIVIALLGALAIGLLGTIDPFEQLKKGIDTTRQQMSSNVYNAVIRNYVTVGTFRWADVDGASLNSVEGTQVLNALIQSGELKTNFLQTANSNLSSVYISTHKEDNSLAVCFLPTSKSFKTAQNNSYDKSGRFIQVCPTEGCYTCVGENPTLAQLPDSNTNSQENQTGTQTQSAFLTSVSTSDIGKPCVGQLLPNGSFEVDSDHNLIPDNWNHVWIPDADEGVQCITSSAGSCSFVQHPYVILGNAHQIRINYGYIDAQAHPLTISGPAGTVFTLSYDSKSSPAPAPVPQYGQTTTGLILYYADGTEDQVALTNYTDVPGSRTPNTWYHAEITLVATKPYVNIYVSGFGHWPMDGRYFYNDNICLTKDR